MWCVYILYSNKLDRFYVGRTENIDLRLEYHNNPIQSRKFTARGIPWVLRLSIPCKSKTQSINLEKYIKKAKSRTLVESLCNDPDRVAEILRRAPDC